MMIGLIWLNFGGCASEKQIEQSRASRKNQQGRTGNSI